VTMRDPDEFAAKLRERGVDTAQRRTLVSVLAGSEQEPDLAEPTVCEGLARIRHYRQATSSGWPDNLLPIAPAARWLGHATPPATMRALVFQNAVCNWRCWYCFVPFNLLAGHPGRSRWVTAEQLIQLYRALPEEHRPEVIDLSGGQPDLVPEWIVWMLDALAGAGLTQEVYLWSDDNLSNDYLFRYLTDDQISRLAAAPNYGRACCLKGFDRPSFAFNTGAPADHFDRQLTLLRRIIASGMDVYCYATFTTPALPASPADTMRRLADQLQNIAECLPLRLIPLEVSVFGPVHARLRATHAESLQLQHHMAAVWQEVLAERFTGPQRAMAITDVPVTVHESPSRRRW
jgi:uncharacterized Fe-S cluster-containing radical SAM superfamily protein